VPLFDFDTPTEAEVYRAAKMGWAHFLHEEEGITIWLRVRVDRLEPGRLILQGSAATLNNPLIYHGFKWIPYVEGWHPGPISWSSVDQAWAARVPYGGGTYTMAPLDLMNPAGHAVQLRREWDENWKLRAAADHAAGHINLAEALREARSRLDAGRPV
jgi:hypothetical protein